MDWSARWLRLAVPAAVAPFVLGGPFRLDLYASTTAHERWGTADERPPGTFPRGVVAEGCGGGVSLGAPKCR